MLDETHIQAFKTYLQGIGKKESTLKHYSITIRQLYELKPKKTPKTLKAKDIEEFIAYLRNKYSIDNKKSPNTLAVKFSAIKRYLKYLKHYKINIIKVDEDFLERPDWIDKEIQILKEEELLRILNASRPSPRDYAMIYTLMDTACRVSEVVTIDLKDINFQNETLKLFDRKVGINTERRVSKECIKAIKLYINNYREESEDTELFLNYKGQRITEQTAKTIVKKSSENAKITKNVTPHSFRHTSITRMMRNGMTNTQARAHTGHKSIKAFERYSHLISDDVADKVVESLSLNNKPQQPKPKANPNPQPSNMSHREELFQLLKEGKITASEYKELLGTDNFSMYQ